MVGTIAERHGKSWHGLTMGLEVGVFSSGNWFSMSYSEQFFRRNFLLTYTATPKFRSAYSHTAPIAGHSLAARTKGPKHMTLNSASANWFDFREFKRLGVGRQKIDTR